VKVVNDKEWRDKAACLDQDPDLFFPIGSSDQAYEQMTVAKRICLCCEALAPCLEWALESGQEAGVCGGLTETERLSLKRRNARKVRKTAHRG